jgi:fructose-1,6-bisphosphatase I
MPETNVITVSRFLLGEERRHPHATGAFTNILHDIAVAAKIISREVNQAGLVDILGRAGSENVHGEDVQKLDVFANDVLYRALDHTGNIAVLASEESEDPIPIPEEFPPGEYVVLYDPLDGSSNIDVNVSIGTIFSILRKVTDGERGTLEDCLQPGTEQLAAGYVLYGSSTMLVYTTGAGVHGCYIGSLVADVHRTLLRGGLFMYPGDSKNAQGKLRLRYEAAPMAMVMEQAGGAASDGRGRLLEVRPSSLHQRIPVYLGSTPFVELADHFLAEDAKN